MSLLDTMVQVIKKHSPEILTGLGVIGVGVGTVMACKATREIDPIIEDHKAEMTDIHMFADTGIAVDKETKESAPYTEKDRRRDTAITYARTGLRFAKLYLPSGAVLTGSVACILGSHKILSTRNLGLTAAYTGIAQSFKEYRDNIIEKYGEAADTEARYSVKSKKKKGKDGEEDTVTYEKTDKTKAPDFSRFIQEDSRYFDKDKNTVLNILFSTERNLNFALKNRRSHIVTLNEIYGALDLEPDLEKGQILGYKYIPGSDPLDENGLPQVIKFEYIVFDNNHDKTIKRTIEEEMSFPINKEPRMLINFPNLVPIV